MMSGNDNISFFETDGIIIPTGAGIECPSCGSKEFHQQHQDMCDYHVHQYGHADGYCKICAEDSGGCISFSNWKLYNCPNGGDCPTSYMVNGFDPTRIMYAERRKDLYIVTIPEPIKSDIKSEISNKSIHTIIIYSSGSFIIHCEVRNGELRPGVLLYVKNAVMEYGPIQHPRNHLDFESYPFYL
jgi:hypothetical protein